MSVPPAAAPVTVPAMEFAFTGGTGRSPAAGGGAAEMDGERLVLLPSAGPPLPVPLLEIRAVAAEDRALRLALDSGETLTLTRLGSRFDGLRDALVLARNEALLDAFWMREEAAAPPVQAELDAGVRRPCELRLMETALVLLYPDADPERLPYALIASVRPEGRTVALDVRWKGRYALAKLGRAFEPFLQSLSRATDALHTAHLDLVRRALPDLDPAVLRRSSGLLRDGVAVPMADLEAAGLRPSVEQAAAAGGASAELAVLQDLAGPSDLRVGVKRGLAGALSGDYLFLLAPVSRVGPAAALEAFRMDATAEAAEGRATYLFRLDGDPGAALDALNRDLLDLNFRREPLLAPGEGLPRRRPAALDALRARLLGRVPHRSPEQWKAEVLALAGTAGKGTP